MYEDDGIRLAKTIAECERLRKLLHDLDTQAEQIDKRLIEIERELPDHCVHLDGPPGRQGA